MQAHHSIVICMTGYTIENAFCHKKVFDKLGIHAALFSPDHQHIIPCDVSVVSGTYLTDAGREQMTAHDL